MAIDGALPIKSGAVTTTDIRTLKGEALLSALEEKGITFSAGEIPKKTVIEWLNNPYSGYIEIARALLTVLSGREARSTTKGSISLTNIKGSIDELKGQHPNTTLIELVKEAYVYRWNESNGGTRDKDLEYIAPKGKLVLSKYEKLNGEGLMRTLESKNITFSDGDIPRATVVKWLDDQFSGYIPVAKAILEYLDSRLPLNKAAYGNVPLAAIKASIDSGMNIEDAITLRWNEKNGGDKNVPIDLIAPSLKDGKNISSQLGIKTLTPTNISGTENKTRPNNYLHLTFDHWKSTFLETIRGNQVARDPLKGEDMPEKRPSEGMGYGMIFSAWLSDPKTFDALSASLYSLYINKSGNSEGLPAWRIDKMGHFKDGNSASDADLDIAISLIKRFKDTGNQEYKIKALGLLHAIKNKEVIAKGSIKILTPRSGLGINNLDGSITINPSYFAVGYFDVFAEIDIENAVFWKQLKSDSYKILNAVFEKYKKFPDWARLKVSDSGRIAVENDPEHGTKGTEELYDGIRTYWRIATDAVWNNDKEAQRLLSKAITEKASRSTTFDGMPDHAIGVFMFTAGLIGAGNKEQADTFTAKTNDGIRSKNNQYYFQLKDNDSENRYYNQSLCLLAKLLIDGKFTRP